MDVARLGRPAPRLLAWAVVGSLLTAAGLARSWLGFVIVVGVVYAFAVMLLYVYHEVVLPLTVGVRCPACRRRTLRRLAYHPHHYECPDCGLRCKRAAFSAPWEDASGPEDAPRYARRSKAGRWLGYTAPVKLGKSTSGILLRNKRQRAGFVPAKDPPGSFEATDPMADPWLDR